MIRPIITNIQALRNPCAPVMKGEKIDSIIQDLKDTLATKNGYGLAANQIGIIKKIAYIKPLQGLPQGLILINPKITGRLQPIKFRETCLSFSGLSVLTKRYNQIALENNGEIKLYAGLIGIIIQHEVAHTNSQTLFEFKWHAK